MSKRGLPVDLKMRHDWHYVEELAKTPKVIGKMIALEKIDPNPDQPRSEIGDLTDLSASIRDKGVLEPLLVKPMASERQSQRWLIIAGERRWRAAQLAGLTEVPCIELDVDESQIAEIALVENLQRKDLNVWEEADGLAALSLRFGYTHEDVARRIGKSRSTVTESLTIAALPNHIRSRCKALKINAKSVILHIARQFDELAMLSAIAALENSSDNIKTLIDTDKSIENADVAVGKNNRTNNIRATSELSSSIQTRSVQTTDLSSPVRTYSYHSPDDGYKLALRFKKLAGKEDIIQSLKQIISVLEKG